MVRRRLAIDGCESERGGMISSVYLLRNGEQAGWLGMGVGVVGPVAGITAAAVAIATGSCVRWGLLQSLNSRLVQFHSRRRHRLGDLDAGESGQSIRGT